MIRTDLRSNQRSLFSQRSISRSIDIESMPGFEIAMKRVSAWYANEIIDRPPVRFIAHNAFLESAKQDISILSHQEKEAWWFDEGMAPVRAAGKWGYIDNTGKVVITPQFDEAWFFSEGLAPVRIGDETSGKWGYIDKTGKFVVMPQFDNAWVFEEGGLASVAIGGTRPGCKDGKWGYIDKNGNYIWSPTR